LALFSKYGILPNKGPSWNWELSFWKFRTLPESGESCEVLFFPNEMSKSVGIILLIAIPWA
jgi:hypothetical protein